MKLPNAEQAVVDLRKLREYCLNFDHPTGKHKARVFASVLGLTADHADALREQLLAAAGEEQALLGFKDVFGQRYVIDFVAEWQGRRAVVRSTWIIEREVDAPRLTSCYIL